MIPLQTPFTALISGPSSSGKSFWIYQLIENREKCTKPSIKRCVWYYSVWQDLFDTMTTKNLPIEFIEGMPSEHAINQTIENSASILLIFDDLMDKISKETTR